MRILLSTYKIKAPDICKIMIVTSVCITPLEVTHFINSVTIVSDKITLLQQQRKQKDHLLLLQCISFQVVSDEVRWF